MPSMSQPSVTGVAGVRPHSRRMVGVCPAASASRAPSMIAWRNSASGSLVRLETSATVSALPMMLRIVPSSRCCTAAELQAVVTPQQSCVRTSQAGSGVPAPGSVLPSVTDHSTPSLESDPVACSMWRMADATASMCGVAAWALALGTGAIATVAPARQATAIARPDREARARGIRMPGTVA